MPKIVASLAQRRRLRRVSLHLYYKHLVFSASKTRNQKSESEYNRIASFFFNKIDPPEAGLNFRHFSAI